MTSACQPSAVPTLGYRAKISVKFTENEQWSGGKHLTKLPASMWVRPDALSLSSNSILTFVGTTPFSFWSPSLAPTSTIFAAPLYLAEDKLELDMKELSVLAVVAARAIAVVVNLLVVWWGWCEGACEKPKF